MMTWIVGIDEAGRGPLAGPVAVGAVRLARDFDVSSVAGAKDSKKMTPLSRERLYGTLCVLRETGVLDFTVAFSDAAMIDSEGIVPAVRSALGRALDALALDPSACEVRLDGGLRAPAAYMRQTTIIRGDQTELAISLASIAAKVERDRLMDVLARVYPAYGLEGHKGYGTVAHRRIISALGPSPIHRRSFCGNIHKESIKTS